MTYLIYDLEIIRCIPTKGFHFDGWQYCSGWDDFAKMGIACAGFAYADGSTGFWDSRFLGLNDLQAALKSACIIGFNSKSFDDRLCAANGVQVATDYDLLEEIRIAAYGSPRWEDCPQGHSYALGKIGSANGFPKTGSGELAPQLWQQGKYQEVIDYCVNDTIITRELLLLGLAGKLRDPNTGAFLTLRELP